MTRTIFIVGLLFVFVSCDPKAACTDQSPISETCPAPVVDTSPVTPVEDSTEGVPDEAALFEANISLNEFDANDEVKVNKAIEIIKAVIRTQAFHERVINFTYNKKKSFVDNDGLTNEQIYQKLLEGSEELKPGIDHEMDLELELYHASTSTVGYTYPNVLRIWMNTKYFDTYTPSEVAGNVFHEWTHKLGFTHASSYSVSRDSSVPYALGYLVEELGKKYE